MFLVDGAGTPAGAAYQTAMSALYTVTFTLKMSRLGPWQPEGYFDYVLPLEGFWWTRRGVSISPCPDHLAVDTLKMRRIRHALVGASLGAGGVRTEKKPGVDLSAGVRLETVTEGCASVPARGAL